MENTKWTLQKEVELAWTRRTLKLLPGVAKSDKISGLEPEQRPIAEGKNDRAMPLCLDPVRIFPLTAPNCGW